MSIIALPAVILDIGTVHPSSSVHGKHKIQGCVVLIIHTYPFLVRL